MRIFVITICSLALVTGAYSAQQEENKQQKKKQPQTVQHAPAAYDGTSDGCWSEPEAHFNGSLPPAAGCLPRAEGD